MITNIVILYMVYALGMPKWCAWCMWIVLGIRIIKMFYDSWKNGR